MADRLFEWMEQHTPEFTDNKEYKLQYTKLFEEFSSLFDQSVESIIIL